MPLAIQEIGGRFFPSSNRFNCTWTVDACVRMMVDVLGHRRRNIIAIWFNFMSPNWRLHTTSSCHCVVNSSLSVWIETTARQIRKETEITNGKRKTMLGMGCPYSRHILHTVCALCARCRTYTISWQRRRWQPTMIEWIDAEDRPKI